MNGERPETAALHGWYVISLRPVGDHAAVRRAAAAHGARVFAISPLRLSPRPDDAALTEALGLDTVIFVSPNAVRHAAARVERLRPRPGAVWCAVGAGTEAALRRAGVAAVTRPERMDSEGLLALPVLADPAGRRIGLIGAPGGRGLLARELRARGAEPVLAEIYQRRPARIAEARIAAMATLPTPCAVLITSAEAWSRLWLRSSAAARRGLRSCMAVTSSERLARLAREHGLRRTLIAGSPRPRALLDTLARHVARVADNVRGDAARKTQFR